MLILTPTPTLTLTQMQPLAGASLGQVHRAVYKGQQVAVKVQRRNLAELFDTDFFNIRLMARIGDCPRV